MIAGLIRRFYNQRVEDFCTRLLYFFNTIDTYFFVAGALAYAVFGLRHGFSGGLAAFAAISIATAAVYKCADFYPTFLLFSPLYVYALAVVRPLSPGAAAEIILVNMAVCAVVQFAFMGIPDSIVARDPSIGIRKIWKSLFTVAPTTVSFPVSVAFSALYTMTLVAGPGPRQLYGLLFWICMAVGACVARLCLPRSFQSPDIRPRPAEALARRVVVVNIDGCRLDRFRDARLPFLSGLASQGCSFPGGLETVYRALTNPAFASILTGATPAVHGITSNNLGQRIRVQALPDIVETKLYGSMHVKHFSKKHWDTFIVSLPVHSIYKSDDIMFEQMKKDLAAGGGTRLFVADISETDFLGHAYGSGSRRYREALMRADGRIAALYGWMRNNRMLGDCAFIVCSDHGIVQIDHSYLLFAAERYVPFIMTGPGVRAGSVIDYRASIMDIAPTISYMLGVSYPDHCRGRVFLDAFERAG